MKRYSPPVEKDRKVFTRTAANTKRINVRPGGYRGGIRL